MAENGLTLSQFKSSSKSNFNSPSRKDTSASEVLSRRISCLSCKKLVKNFGDLKINRSNGLDYKDLHLK